MGLSILIPIYNYNVTALVEALHGQLTTTQQDGEIILLDDGSTPSFFSANKILENGLTVRFFANENNRGRIASRRRLSELAQYDNLLFLDCDSEIIRNDFLFVYFNCINKGAILISGGRLYANEVPSDCNLKLHWKYGSERESKASAFMSNNFFIKKELFNQLDLAIPFSGYGHEDSWWGIQFEKMGVRCECINNPILHTGIEKSSVFIDKSETALNNLLLLEKNVDHQLLSKHVKIFRWYRRLKASGLAGLYLFIEKPFHRFFFKNLLSCNPSLFYFDCYRLALLLKKSKNNHS